MGSKYKKFIKKGIYQPLQNIPFHNKATFLKRLLMQDKSTFPDLKRILPGSNYHIAVHIINKLPKKVPKYVEPHIHNCDEINLILSEKGKLVYKITMGNESYTVSSPSIVYVPRRVAHTAEAVRGKGIYFCIVMSKSYKDSLVKE